MINIIKPSFEILTPIQPEILKLIELAGRTCYKSEDKITEESANRFVKMICKNNHESVIEHASVSVRFICDRGVTHELVRHRIASYSQESTRYVNYNCKGLTFIKPSFFDDNGDQYGLWYNAMLESAHYYNKMIENGAKAQEARSVLPNSLKTEIVATMNLRSWKNFFKLRCSKGAHPQFAKVLPEVFNDL
jgi:thymidylate synthase (FAD)